MIAGFYDYLTAFNQKDLIPFTGLA